MFAFKAEEATLEIQANIDAMNDKFRCFQCLSEMSPRFARSHVGEHLMKAKRDVKEELKGSSVCKFVQC